MPQDCVGYAHLLHAVAPEEASEAGIPSTEAEMTALDTTDLATLVSNASLRLGYAAKLSLPFATPAPPEDPFAAVRSRH